MSRFRMGNKPRIVIAFLVAGGMALFLGLALYIPTVEAAQPFQIITSTPMEDGAIVHIVQDGENLASISEVYGVSMADLRGLNGMAPTSNLIFPGQKLIIRLPLPPTETPTITATVQRPTRTPTMVTPTRTPRPTRTVTPTYIPSATRNPAVAAVSDFFDSSQRPLLIAMIIICIVGLAWTLWAGFRPTNQGKD
jgi:LysM repeat protein